MNLFNVDNFLNSYILAPFILAIILSFSTFLNAPSIIRNIVRFFFFCQAISSLSLLIFFNESSFCVFNFSFSLDITASILLFLSNLIFFLFSIISRTFILEFHRIFFVCCLLLSGLINTFLMSDSITIILMCVFWIFLVQYFLSSSFCTKQDKKYISLRFLSDIFCFLLALLLICLDFVRYFLLNHIPFNFSEIASNLAHINNFSAILAFFGFMILVFRFFNFIPFNGCNFKSNSLVSTQNTLCYLILGGCLLSKTYPVFNSLFFDYENYIVIYLIINFIYFLMLSLRCDNIIKYVSNLLPVFIITALFALFSYDSIGFASFVYFILVACLSYCFMYFIAILLEYKYQSADINSWGKIKDESKLTQFFIAASLLNLARIPLLPIFSSTLVSLAAIFSVDYEKSIFAITSYILVFGILATSISMFSTIYKIIVEPSLNPEKEFILAKHQIITFTILLLVLIIIGLSTQHLFGELALNLGDVL